ncbi:hypothetical protein [Caulobacter mirabilis]|uniref:Uncharacterized protein n=1 Tax=Caulobacter mirabilis TaxID=69666 RepID=A0A2D2AY78_9CAUL|nr:hypothetical protein [Caulobacter mirabilis]ATQ42887.1 hypothetical protein CSW64_10930 [Caulobacter mirabilis]
MSLSSPIGGVASLFSTTAMQRLNTAAPKEKGAPETATEAFFNHVKKTPAEQMMEAMLKRRGLTQEAFNALPPEQRQAIMEDIKKEIMDKVKNGEGPSKGALADITV